MGDIPDPLREALMVLARWNIPPDVQEMLISGNPAMSIPPGALSAAIEVATDAAEEAAVIINTCDVPGCSRPVSCGWPSPTGYRRTCAAHWEKRDE